MQFLIQLRPLHSGIELICETLLPNMKQQPNYPENPALPATAREQAALSRPESKKRRR